MRLAGIGEGKVQNYAQFTYVIMGIILGLKSEGKVRAEKGIEELTREDIDKIADILVNREGWSLYYCYSVEDIEETYPFC